MAAEKPVWVAPDDSQMSPNVDTEPVTGRPGSLSAASGLGRWAQLIALRDRLATIIDNPESLARDVASLSIRYMKVVADIDALDSARAARDGDELDEAAGSPDEGFDPTTV